MLSMELYAHNLTTGQVDYRKVDLRQLYVRAVLNLNVLLEYNY